jgi:acyl-CoA thioesterase FadM
MRLYFRLLTTSIQARYREPLTPLDESNLSLRVMPSDIDCHGRMHTSRYLNIMELGWIDFSARVGLLNLSHRRHWKMRTIAVNMNYLCPLRLLQNYTLSTRLLYWDNQYFYLEQRFSIGKNTVAIAQLKTMMCGRHDSIAPGYILELLGYDPASPKLPSAIKHWMQVN